MVDYFVEVIVCVLEVDVFGVVVVDFDLVE